MVRAWVRWRLRVWRKRKSEAELFLWGAQQDLRFATPDSLTGINLNIEYWRCALEEATYTITSLTKWEQNNV